LTTATVCAEEVVVPALLEEPPPELLLPHAASVSDVASDTNSRGRVPRISASPAAATYAGNLFHPVLKTPRSWDSFPLPGP
jgi:hypothetical protein